MSSRGLLAVSIAKGVVCLLPYVRGVVHVRRHVSLHETLRCRPDMLQQRPPATDPRRFAP